MNGRLFAFALLGVAAASLWAGEAPKPQQDQELSKLIDRLASESYEEREEAQRRLAEAGAAALPLLRAKLTTTSDLETKTRIQNILLDLEATVVVINAKGELELNGKPYTSAALTQIREAFATAQASTARDKAGNLRMRVVIEVHDQAPYTAVQRVMVDCMRLGIWRIAVKDPAKEQGKDPAKGQGGLLDVCLPVDEEGAAAALEKPEELSIFIKDDAKARAEAPDKARSATFYIGSRDAPPVKGADAMIAMVAMIKALAEANPDQEVLIALYDELNDKDQLVQFAQVKSVILMCRKAGIKVIKFQAPVAGTFPEENE